MGASITRRLHMQTLLSEHVHSPVPAWRDPCLIACRTHNVAQSEAAQAGLGATASPTFYAVKIGAKHASRERENVQEHPPQLLRFRHFRRSSWIPPQITHLSVQERLSSASPMARIRPATSTFHPRCATIACIKIPPRGNAQQHSSTLRLRARAQSARCICGFVVKPLNALWITPRGTSRQVQKPF